MKNLALVLVLLALGLGLFHTTAAADGLLLPVISVTPGSYDFGSVPLGAVATGYLVVTNSGDLPLIVSAVKTKAPFGDGATSFTVPSGGSRRVTIFFIPTSTGSFSSVCTFLSNAANAPVLNVPLFGTGIE